MFRLDSRPAAYLLLTALWAALCLPNLGGPSLWDIDEGNNAECFREMLAGGNLIVPTFNYRLREDKPALLYWLQIASAQVVGVNEWAARLPSALASLLTVVTVYELGRRMFSALAALLAGVILATSFAFLGAAHFANPDALLLAFSTLALALFWHDFQSGGNGSLLAVGVAAGLAVLAKGPVGIVLPGGVAVLFLFWQRRPGYLWDRRIFTFLFFFLLVAVPWYALVAAETKGAWIKGFWSRHHADRMTTALESHSGPFVYYLPVLLGGLAPWSIFLGVTGWHAWDRLRRGEERDRPAVRLLLVWFGLYFVFFSAVRTKLPNYILPCYPPAALLTAHFLDRWLTGEAAVPAWLIRIGLGCLALLGVGMGAGLAVAAGVGELPALRGHYYPGLLGWAWLGAILVVGAAAGWWQLRAGRRGGVIGSVALSGGLFAALLLAGGIDALESHKATRTLAQALPDDHESREVRLAAYSWFQPSLVFYCRREVERLGGPEWVRTFLAQPLPAYLFVPEEVWAGMSAQMPPGSRVIGRGRDLYTRKMILVVANGAEEGQARAVAGGPER